MTIADGIYKVCVHVGSQLIEKILLDISPDWLSRAIGKIPSRHREGVLGEAIHFRSVDSIWNRKNVVP